MTQEIAEVGKFYGVIIEFFASYSLQIVGAAIIVFAGFLASKHVHKYMLRLLVKNHIDQTLSLFVANIFKFLVIMIALILALGKLGISIAPFIAAFGALSLTAGLALQGSVSNFAAGVVLIVTKPFKIGDTITIHDVYGAVQEIKLAYTVLLNEDKEQITVPNKYMIGDILVNSYEYRIIEGSVGISYESSVGEVVELIKKTLQDSPTVSDFNEVIVGVEKFADSSISIGYRYWVRTESYFKSQYDVNLKIFEALKSNGVVIPFPQREIRIIGEKIEK